MDGLYQRPLNLPAVFPRLVTAQLYPVQPATAGYLIHLFRRRVDEHPDYLSLILSHGVHYI